MKRFLAIIISIILVLNILPVSALENDTSFADYKEALYYTIYNMEEEVILKNYNVTLDEVEDYLGFLVNQRPEIGYSVGIAGGNYVGQGPYINKLKFSYPTSKEEVAMKRAYIDEYLAPVLAKIKANWNDTQKALYIHDWLDANFMYDYRLYEESGKENHDIYGFLKDGMGVCQSYAYTFMYMARKVGLESYMAISPAKDTDGDGSIDIAGHGWNVVKVDGNWYHLDATNDDPILGVQYHYDYVGEVSHEKFLLSDEQIVTDVMHLGFYIPFVDETIVCNEYIGNDLWRNSVSSVLNVGEYWYYLDPKGINGGLLRTKDFKTAERVMEIGFYYEGLDTYCWPINEDETSGYPRYYTGLFELNEHLFFSDSKNIYVYDTHHDVAHPLPIERAEGNFYYGINLKNKTLTYITSRTNIAENVVQGSYTLGAHFLVTEWEVLKEPTETQEGLKAKRCYYCGEVVESQTIPPLSQIKRGDINGDTIVDTIDLAALKLYLAGAGAEVGAGAYVDDDYDINTLDLAKLKLYLAGALSEL